MVKQHMKCIAQPQQFEGAAIGIGAAITAEENKGEALESSRWRGEGKMKEVERGQ